MSFYRFKDEDIIQTHIKAFPSYTVELNGNQVTGSVFLEKPYLDGGLRTRLFRGFSAKEGGIIEKNSPFTASIDIIDVELNATNKQLYESVLELYDFYSFRNENYTSNFTGSTTTRFRVMTVPEIYYDREILTGSFSASDNDSSGDSRNLFDDGLGGIYSGSLTGTLVGNIFYSEGLVIFKGGGLNDEASSNDFGEASPNNFKWRVNLKGTHTIPVKIFRCRAPAGQLNASTNSTFYTIPTGSADEYRNERKILLPGSGTYITSIGLYNNQYELVALANLAQPIKKNESQDILFKVSLDW